MIRKLLAGLLILGISVEICHSHGRLMDPPSRSSLWRLPEFYPLNLTVNFEDNQLFCGGFDVQYEHNGGECGICGDAYNQTEPRDNEDGGIYGQGIISRKFRAGQIIPVDVEITASHWGHWELRLCPENPATQECLDRHVLHFAGNSGTRYNVTGDYGVQHYYSTAVQLPKKLKCKQCTLQWHYRTANRWGECEDGSGAMGCGPQEIFRGCSDISID